MSPLLHRSRGFRFFFWSSEPREPPHVHVVKAESQGKWWLQPVRRAYSSGFSPGQVRYIEDILEQHQEQFLEEWYEYHGKEE